jgi:hypothetical protein
VAELISFVSRWEGLEQSPGALLKLKRRFSESLRLHLTSEPQPSLHCMVRSLKPKTHSKWSWPNAA